ncbi:MULTISPECIES: rubrerythrin family protein [unclassified Archaeoglobus]|uniref:rubrerythrin family protein n=1 Tax=unclassified Archaeoglobus TaxID=2643606 RepID=UPI0025BC74B5|nr:MULTISPECIES: rubrerythrin family protein [unclassified Archaeoglobus]
MSTEDNLRDAYAGESQAMVRYRIYAEIARNKGMEGIARVFEAASFSEFVHAKNHLKVLEDVSDVSKNLKTAHAGETYEITEMYPKFYAEAEKEGNKRAMNSIRWALETEKVHAEIFKKVLDSGKDYDGKIYICSVCGYAMEDEAPDRCPLCNTPKDRFVEF